MLTFPPAWISVDPSPAFCDWLSPTLASADVDVAASLQVRGVRAGTLGLVRGCGCRCLGLPLSDNQNGADQEHHEKRTGSDVRAAFKSGIQCESEGADPRNRGNDGQQAHLAGV
jgi:hypothetical protein